MLSTLLHQNSSNIPRAHARRTACALGLQIPQHPPLPPSSALVTYHMTWSMSWVTQPAIVPISRKVGSPVAGNIAILRALKCRRARTRCIPVQIIIYIIIHYIVTIDASRTLRSNNQTKKRRKRGNVRSYGFWLTAFQATEPIRYFAPRHARRVYTARTALGLYQNFWWTHILFCVAESFETTRCCIP